MPYEKGTRFVNKRTGRNRTLAGYTTKPANDQPSDKVRRARLVADDGTETRPTVAALERSYRVV